MSENSFSPAPSLLKAPIFSSSITHGFGTKFLSNDLHIFSEQTHLAPEKIRSLKQVHGGNVIVVDSHLPFHFLPEADALVTDLSGIVLAIRTADCLPLLIQDAEKNVVAAIHAGWRGLVNGVIENTFSAMKQKYGSQPESCLAALGPCISKHHFEVGPEVTKIFREKCGNLLMLGERRNGKDFIDLPATAKKTLEKQGCLTKNIHVSDFCTFERSDLFHSFRREPECGRQISFIGL